MDRPWFGFPADDPRSNPYNYASYDEGVTWSYLGDIASPTPGAPTVPPAGSPPGPPPQSYSITGESGYTGQPPAAPSYDPLSSAYPVSQPTYSGTPGTGSSIANPYDPSTVAAGEQAAYEQLLAAGEILPSADQSGLTSPAPGAPSTAIAPGNPVPTDPYGTSSGSDPFTGQPSYDASYQTDAGGGWTMPTFGGQASNPGRQQPVIPGQFDPFAWSGNPNPMLMMQPNEMREMVLGAMELGAEVQKQQTEPPRFDARQYALHRLGLMEPAPEAPPVPFLPQRSPFGV
ncbi:MAG: hypothetical protein JNM64_09750 [Chloroflexia bacterium]|nr:hypothetical protein [Chloroflexia bacterium]